MSATKHQTPELTHAWVAMRFSDEVQVAMAGMAIGADGKTHLSCVGRVNVYVAGSPAPMARELDKFMLDRLAEGFMPLPEAGATELTALANALGVPAPSSHLICSHLHASAEPWGPKLSAVELSRLSADRVNNALYLRPRAERALLAFDPAHGSRLINYAGSSITSRSLWKLQDVLVDAELPPLVLDVALSERGPTLMADLLSYDGVDLRSRPFSERRALINQIAAELVGIGAESVLAPLLEALPEQAALRATALINRRAPFGAWKQGR